MPEAQAHRVFISWSGDLSNKIALAIRDWIAVVIQSSNPFMSQADIVPGDRALTRISSELRDIKVGLFCVTAENQNSKWLNYEAGAISKMVDESHVVPILFDLKKGQLEFPLAQFQAVNITKDEMKKVAESINTSMANPVTTETLERTFDLAWNRLESSIDQLRTDHTQKTLITPPKRSSDDMFEEIIELLRETSISIDSINDHISNSNVVRDQMELSQSTIRRISTELGLKTHTNVAEIAKNARNLGPKEWSLIASAPLLRWWLEVYYGVSQESHGGLMIDDVPF